MVPVPRHDVLHRTCERFNVSPEQAKILFDAKERIQKEMSASMDALEAKHGTDTVIVAHFMASMFKTFEMPKKVPMEWPLLRSLLENQVDELFGVLCGEMKIDYDKAREVSKGIYETICMHESDLSEAVKSINQQGESNGTKNA